MAPRHLKHSAIVQRLVLDPALLDVSGWLLVQDIREVFGVGISAAFTALEAARQIVPPRFPTHEVRDEQ